MTTDRIERTIHIKAPIAHVWSVVTSAEHLAGWFGDSAEIDLRPGGALTLSWAEYGRYDCVIERVEPPTLVAWRGPVTPGEPADPGGSTLVEFTLAEEGDGTRLTVVESGFDSLDMTEEQRQEQHDGNFDGWEVKGDELKAYAEATAGR